MLPKPKTKRKGYIIDFLYDQRLKRKRKEINDPNYRLKSKINWDNPEQTPNKRAHSIAYTIDNNENSLIVPINRFDNKEIDKSEDLYMQQKLDILRTKARRMEEEAIIKEKKYEVNKNICKNGKWNKWNAHWFHKCKTKNFEWNLIKIGSFNHIQ